MKKKIYNLSIILFGNFVFSGSRLFYTSYRTDYRRERQELRFCQHYTGLQISTFVTIFNVTMFILGALFLGEKKFAMTTLVSTFVYPFFFKNRMLSTRVGVLTTDPMLWDSICRIADRCWNRISYSGRRIHRRYGHSSAYYS